MLVPAVKETRLEPLRFRMADAPVTMMSSASTLWLPVRVQVPELTAKSALVPVIVMPPEITPVPVALPVRVRPPAPAVMGPERVSVAPTPPLAVTVRVAPPRSTGPLSCRLLLPVKVSALPRLTLLATAFAPERSVPAWRVLAPETVNVPDPRDALSPNSKVPADSVVPPE